MHHPNLSRVTLLNLPPALRRGQSLFCDNVTENEFRMKETSFFLSFLVICVKNSQEVSVTPRKTVQIVPRVREQCAVTLKSSHWQSSPIRLHTLTFCFLKSGFPLKHHNSWFQKFVWFVLKSLCCSHDPFFPCSPFYRRIWIFIFLLIWLACRNQAGAGAASHPKPAGVTSMVVALWHLRPWLVVWSSLEIMCCKGSSRFFWRASCS